MAPPKKRVRLVRIVAHLEPQSLEWLKVESLRLDVSMSEVIRRLVRAEREGENNDGCIRVWDTV